MVMTTGIDKLDLADADLLVDARAVLLNGQRGLHRTTNGYFLLVLLRLFSRTLLHGNCKRLVETVKKSTRFHRHSRRVVINSRSNYSNYSDFVRLLYLVGSGVLVDAAIAS